MKPYFFYTDELTVGYDGKPLIKKINIEVNQGEILTLIGPNGARKIHDFKKHYQAAGSGGRLCLAGQTADEPYVSQRNGKKHGRCADSADQSGVDDL